MLLPDRGNLRVVCGLGTLLEVHELQLEGRKRLLARDFLNGVRPSSGEKLGV
jgi:methionyl-tRNA formyltransferase